MTGSDILTQLQMIVHGIAAKRYGPLSGLDIVNWELLYQDLKAINAVVQANRPVAALMAEAEEALEAELLPEIDPLKYDAERTMCPACSPQTEIINLREVLEGQDAGTGIVVLPEDFEDDPDYNGEG